MEQFKKIKLQMSSSQKEISNKILEQMSPSQKEISGKILKRRLQIVWGPPVIIFHIFSITVYMYFIALLLTPLFI